MNLTELSALLSSATDVLRVETLDAYSSPSDADYLERYRRGEPKPDPAEKQPWLDRLAAAAERGHPWRRLRVVSRPVSEYVRYACEFGYVDNVAAGEDVRVLDEFRAPRMAREMVSGGDFLVLDGRPVVMHYSAAGGFRTAIEVPDHQHWAYLQEAEAAWSVAVAFSAWWSENVDLHRQLADA